MHSTRCLAPHRVQHACCLATKAPLAACCCCTVIVPALQLVQILPAVEQQVLMQFDVGAWTHPLPSKPRHQADQQQRLPQESIGLWVPPHPRINKSSLYKLEQRLAKGRPLDLQKIVRALQEQFPASQQPGRAPATSTDASQAVGKLFTTVWTAVFCATISAQTAVATGRPQRPSSC